MASGTGFCRARPSRKKFQEALKALKQACKSEKLPFVQRIRAAELICAIYDVPLPESSYRTKRATKELVEEGKFDAEIREQVSRKLQEDALASARRFLKQTQGENGNNRSTEEDR